MPDQTTDRRWVALGDLLRPDLGRWLGLGAIVAFGSAMALAGPLLIREILDRSNAGTTSAEISRLALLFLLTAALAQFSAVAAAWYATVAAWRASRVFPLPGGPTMLTQREDANAVARRA